MDALIFIFAQVPDVAPSPDALPGAPVARNFLSGLMFYSLIFCLVGLVLSAGIWAVGAFSNNYNQSVAGKKGFLIAVGAALVVGASVYLINYSYGIGDRVRGGRQTL